MLAFIRNSTSWETPLFVHVAAAMLLVGGLFAVAVALGGSWRASESDAIALRRFAYRTLFIVVLPAFVIMRIAAQWVLSKSPFGDLKEDPNWVGIGFVISDIGALVLIVALILAGLGLRRTGSGQTSSRVVTVLTFALLAAYVVAIWAMTTKPN
jgi:hypothetical protein